MRSLVLFLMLLPAAGVSAQPESPSQQSEARSKDAPQEVSAAPSNPITIPDGTPLTVELVSELSSESAKVGDVVPCITAHALRINGLVVLPKGTEVSGIVVGIGHPHRPAHKNGWVSVAFDKVVFPSGDAGTTRPSKESAGNSVRMAARAKAGDPADHLSAGMWAAGVVFDPLTVSIFVPLFLLSKGDEAVSPSGSRRTIYLNGPLKLDRGAVLALQPPPYQGPPEVFFSGTSKPSKSDALFCGDTYASMLSGPLTFKLIAGTYSFSKHPEWNSYYYARMWRDDAKAAEKRQKKIDDAEHESKLKAKPAQLEMQNDRQYWISWDKRGLRVMDSQAYRTEFDSAREELEWTVEDFTRVDRQALCPQLVQPAATASAGKTK